MIQRQTSRHHDPLQQQHPSPVVVARIATLALPSSQRVTATNFHRRFPFSFCILRELMLFCFILSLRWALLSLWERSSYSSTTLRVSQQQQPDIVPYEINITVSSGGGADRTNPSATKSTLLIQSLAPRTCRDNAIVIMAQKKHSTYDRDSYGLLLKALDLLYQNYFQQDSKFIDNVDVYIFHTGDLQVNPDLVFIESHLVKGKSSSSTSKGLVHLVNLKESPFWQLPAWHKHDNVRLWSVSDIFPVGYRHMCRWFGIQIWNFFKQLNQQQSCKYRYILRIDEDSFIHSPIRYDIFDFMKEHQYVYGYRLCAYELDYNKLVYSWFTRWHEKTKPLRTIDWELCGFYNNFFVADLEFFNSRKVRSFLKEIDRMGFVYRKRYGDLIIHTMAVYSFAKTEQIHRFLDFTYQHVTIDHILTPEKGCVVWGGIQAGYNDPNAKKTLDEYYQKRVIGRGCTANVTVMGAADLSPTYSHLSPEQQKSLALKTIVAGKVEIPNKGILSG